MDTEKVKQFVENLFPELNLDDEEQMPLYENIVEWYKIVEKEHSPTHSTVCVESEETGGWGRTSEAVARVLYWQDQVNKAP